MYITMPASWQGNIHVHSGGVSPDDFQSVRCGDFVARGAKKKTVTLMTVFGIKFNRVYKYEHEK